MGLKMENFHVFGVYWKFQLLGVGSRKTNIERGAWAVCRFKGGGAWHGIGGGVFDWGGGRVVEGWCPNAHCFIFLFLQFYQEHIRTIVWNVEDTRIFVDQKKGKPIDGKESSPSFFWNLNEFERINSILYHLKAENGKFSNVYGGKESSRFS